MAKKRIPTSITNLLDLTNDNINLLKNLIKANKQLTLYFVEELLRTIINLLPSKSKILRDTSVLGKLLGRTVEVDSCKEQLTKNLINCIQLCTLFMFVYYHVLAESNLLKNLPNFSPKNINLMTLKISRIHKNKACTPSNIGQGFLEEYLDSNFSYDLNVLKEKANLTNLFDSKILPMTTTIYIPSLQLTKDFQPTFLAYKVDYLRNVFDLELGLDLLDLMPFEELNESNFKKELTEPEVNYLNTILENFTGCLNTVWLFSMALELLKKNQIYSTQLAHGIDSSHVSDKAFKKYLEIKERCQLEKKKQKEAEKQNEENTTYKKTIPVMNEDDLPY